MTCAPDPSSRAAQLAAALDAVRGRIGAATDAVGRDLDEVTLIGVTKTYPALDAQLLVSMGVHDLGESRANEARDKSRQIDGAGTELRWHFVGQLQTNKAKIVAGFATAVHSLDRAALVDALDRAVSNGDRGPLDVFLQVSLDDDPQRGGVVVDQLPRLADQVVATTTLRLRGVMAVAPQAMEPDVAFARLAAISADLAARHLDASAISAGMSDDLESAIRHGATHVRVGSALLGRRPPDVS